MTAPEHWPLFDLTVTTPRLVLRYVDDDVAAQLMALVVERGVHDAAEMPFGVPWTRAASPVLERNGMQHFWGMRAGCSPASWALPMAVFEDGRAVGIQTVSAVGFGTRKTVETGSWLLKDEQGRGIGKEMRAAVLHLAFDGLGAEAALTSAFVDNPASQGVTRSLGYVENGFDVHDREGIAVRQQRFLLDRSTWRRRDDITVQGLERCLPVLLGDDGDAPAAGG